MRGGWLRGAAAALAALALAAALVSGLHRVPEGSMAVEGAVTGRGMPSLVRPGFHFHMPFLRRVVVFPSAPVKVEGLLNAPALGRDMALPYTAWLAAPRGEPAALLSHAPGGNLARGARRLLEARVAGGGPPAAAGRGELLKWLERQLAPLGLVEGSLVLGSPLTVPPPGSGVVEELRRAYEAPAQPVLLIGLDGADWDVMEPLMMNGELPALRGLREHGAWGVLRSMKPTLSPLLWTTVATGRTPDEHGVLDFLVADASSGEEIPITSRHRKAAALWNMLTALDQPSLTVGWWATWPAEEVSGVLVSDRVAYSLFESGGVSVLEGSVYPPGLAGTVRDLVVGPREVSLEDVRRIIRISPEELEELKARLDDPVSWEDPAGHLLRILASTLTYHRITLDRLEQGQPPLTLVYYQGIDEVSHRFAHYAPPAMEWADRSRLDGFRDAVENFYRFQDRLVGELLDAVAPESRVLVISDHGFAWGPGRPTDMPPDIEGKPGRWHTLDGVILARGPGVAPGRLPRDASLLDVTPTILALLGLPAAESMPGRAITEIAGEGADARHPRIPSWDAALGSIPGEASLASGVDAEMLARLAALGYIATGPEPSGEKSEPSVTGHLNRGNALLARGDCEGAQPAFRAALALAPDYVPAHLGLGQCLIATGSPEEGWAEIGRALRDGQNLDPGIYMKVARFYHARGESRRGADLFAGLPPREDLEAARQVALAVLLQAAGDASGAREAVRRGLELDPTIPEGLQLVYDLLTAEGELAELESILDDALAARPDHEEAANFLALTLERMGRVQEAAEVLQAHLMSSPRSLPTLVNLAGISIRRGENRRAVGLLRRALEIRPDHMESRVNLVVAMGRLGDLEGAEEIYRASGELSAPVEMINAMALAFHGNGRMDRARELLARSLEIRPAQPEVQRLLDSIE